MIFPIPNVLYMKSSEAIERLKNEYEIKVLYVETNKYLPDVVISYKPINNVLVLEISKAPKESFSLDEGITYVSKINYVTGPKSENYKLLSSCGVGATDLGICVKTENKYLFLYGDTFSGNDVNDGYWNSNFIGEVSLNNNFNNGIVFEDIVKDTYGMIKPICQGKHDRDKVENLDVILKKEVTKIPTGGIELNGNVYVFLMSVRHWGKPGEWFVTENMCYKASSNDLTNFKKVDSLVFKESFSNRFGQIYPFLDKNDANHVYFLAIPGGRFGYISLLRVKKDNFEDINKYELLVGKNKFMNLIEGVKEEPYYLVKDEMCGEPSIMYNAYLNEYLISTLTDKGIKLYRSKDLTNTFKDNFLIMNADKVQSCYGGFIHDDLSLFNGKKIYMQVSEWSPVYNTSLYEIVFK